MQCLQFIYTSCRTGLSGAAGFQTYSVSEGLSEAERRELEELAAYSAPLDSPVRPTEEQLAHFPVAFGFFQLESGRYGVYQSKYVGKDYSRRAGNFFAHALVLESGLFPFYPIELWRSSVFRHRLSPDEEKAVGVPAPLEAVPLERIPVGERLTPGSTQEFVQEGDRPERLQWFLSALLNSGAMQRRLVVCEPSQDDVAHWIAAGQMALPLDLAHLATFTTYCIDPERTSSLVASTTREGSRFAFSRTQRDFDFFVLDGVQDDRSDIPSPGRYAALAAQGLCLGWENLAHLHRFMSGFQLPPVLGQALDEAAYLYSVSRSADGFALPPCSADAFSTAASCASARVQEDLARAIESNLEKLQLNREASQAIGALLLSWDTKVQTERSWRIAVRFCTEALFSILLLQDAEVAWAPSFNQAMASLCRDPKRLRADIAALLIRDAAAVLEDGLPSQAAALLRIVAEEGIDQIERCPGWQRCCQVCFTSLSRDSALLARTLAEIQLPARDWARLCAQAGRQMPGEETQAADLFAELLIQFAQREGQDSAQSVREAWLAAGMQLALQREYEILLSRAGDKREFFDRYCRTVLDGLPSLKRAWFSTALRAYLDSLPPQAAADERLRWLKQADQVEDELLADIFRRFESALEIRSLFTDSSGGLLRHLAQIKAKRQVRSKPDVIGLILAARKLCDRNGNRIDFRADAIPFSLKTLTEMEERQYADFLACCLPPLLNQAKRPEDIEALLGWLAAPNKSKAIAQRLAKEAARSRNLKREPSTLLLLLLCQISRDRPRTASLQDAVEQLDDALAQLVAGLKEKDRQRLNRQLKNSCARHDKVKRMQKRWTAFLAKVKEAEERRPRGLARLIATFSQAFKGRDEQ